MDKPETHFGWILLFFCSAFILTALQWGAVYADEHIIQNPGFAAFTATPFGLLWFVFTVAYWPTLKVDKVLLALVLAPLMLVLLAATFVSQFDFGWMAQPDTLAGVMFFAVGLIPTWSVLILFALSTMYLLDNLSLLERPYEQCVYCGVYFPVGIRVDYCFRCGKKVKRES